MDSDRASTYDEANSLIRLYGSAANALGVAERNMDALDAGAMCRPGTRQRLEALIRVLKRMVRNEARLNKHKHKGDVQHGS